MPDCLDSIKKLMGRDGGEYIKLAKEQKKVANELYEDDEWDDSLKDQWNCLPLHLISAIINLHREEFCRLVTEIKRETNLNSTTMPLAVFDIKEQRLKVFPNIILKMSEFMSQVPNTFISGALALEDALTPIIDAKGPTKQRYEPEARLYKTLTTTRLVSVDRYVSQLKACDKWSSSRVRNLAAAIKDEFAPADIVECKTMEDYTFMYREGPPSCMQERTEGDWEDLTASTGHHPAIFYHYIPEITGIYLRKGGKAHARTFMYTTKKGKYYGRIYKNNEQAEGKLIAYLKKKGYKQTNVVEADTKQIRIPGLWVKKNKDFACPLPYVDVFKHNFMIRFDVPSKEFVLTNKPEQNDKKHHGKYKKIDVGTRGLAFAKEIVLNIPCPICGNTIIRRGVTTLDGMYRFCGQECANSAGYVQAYRSDSQSVHVLKTEAIKSASNSNRYYTNLNAAAQHAEFPYINSLDQFDRLPSFDRVSSKRTFAFKKYIVTLSDHIFTLLTHGHQLDRYKLMGTTTLKNSATKEAMKLKKIIQVKPVLIESTDIIDW